METRQQRLLREALEHDSKSVGKGRARDEKPEATLRDKSLEHTDPAYVPRTLTPHEWEAYYAEHGVPRGHRVLSERQGKRTGSLLRYLKRCFGGASRRREGSPEVPKPKDK